MPRGQGGGGAGRRLIPIPDANTLMKQIGPILQKQVAEISKKQAQSQSSSKAASKNRNRASAYAKLLQAGALLRSLPKGPTPDKELRFRGGATSNQYFAPRGLGYYDAFATTPDAAILATTVGPSTPIEGFSRAIIAGYPGVTLLPYPVVSATGPTVNLEATTNAKLLVFNPGSSDSVLAHVYEVYDDNGFAKVRYNPVSAVAFTELGPTATSMSSVGDQEKIQLGLPIDGDLTARVESIPLRGSLRLRNITEHFQVGGEVRVLRYNGGLSLKSDPEPHNSNGYVDMTPKEFLLICDMMRQTKRATTLGAEELRKTHQFNTYPADSIRSHTFLSDTSFEESVATPKFCTLIVLFDDFKSGSGTGNTYSVDVVVHRAARFAPGSLLHNKARVLPSHALTHTKNQQAEASGPVAKIVSAATQMAPYVQTALKAKPYVDTMVEALALAPKP
jgi:hypothetical protein